MLWRYARLENAPSRVALAGRTYYICYVGRGLYECVGSNDGIEAFLDEIWKSSSVQGG